MLLAVGTTWPFFAISLSSALVSLWWKESGCEFSNGAKLVFFNLKSLDMLCQSFNVKVAVLNQGFFSACGQEHGSIQEYVPSFARDECLDTAVWSLCCSLVLFGGSLSAKR